MEVEENEKEKSAVQLKKDAKRKEKDEKFKEKQAKVAAAAAVAAPKEVKAKVEKTTEPSAQYTSNTALGDKKDTKCQLPDAYSPVYVEAAWYEWWEKMGFFKPECAVSYIIRQEIIYFSNNVYSTGYLFQKHRRSTKREIHNGNATTECNRHLSFRSRINVLS